MSKIITKSESQKEGMAEWQKEVVSVMEDLRRGEAQRMERLFVMENNILKIQEQMATLIARTEGEKNSIGISDLHGSSAGKRTINLEELPMLSGKSEVHRKLELPVFNGNDPKGWVCQADRYFHINRLSETEKLEAALVLWQ